MSNHLIHLVLQHVYVWTLPSVTIAAIRRGFWQEGDGAKYLCRPGVPSPHRHLEGWEASHGGPVLKGGGTADRTRCQRTELERDDFISGIAQSVKTATVDVVVSALPNATGNRRENMLPLRVQFRSWELDRVSPLFQRFLPKSLEGNCNY